MTETIERTVSAAPARVWELWTTAEGISSWWAPEGFRTDVTRLDLTPGGELVYTMTAVGRQEVAFMDHAGIPLSTTERKEFTELDAPMRLGYVSLVDCVPEVEPYQHRTVVTLERTGAGTDVIMELEPLHDETWTEQLRAGRANQLDNLARLIDRARLRDERRTY